MGQGQWPWCVSPRHAAVVRLSQSEEPIVSFLLKTSVVLSRIGQLLQRGECCQHCGPVRVPEGPKAAVDERGAVSSQILEERQTIGRCRDPRRTRIVGVADTDHHSALHEAVDQSRQSRCGHALPRGEVAQAHRHASRDGGQCGQLRLGQLTEPGTPQPTAQAGHRPAQARSGVTVQGDAGGLMVAAAGGTWPMR